MNINLLFKCAVTATSGSVVFYHAFHHPNDISQRFSSYFSRRFASAATVETDPGKWDNNWDRRAHEKPTATRNIIFIRHGQYNLAGSADKDRYLTSLGKEQAICTGNRLKSLGIDKKVTSIFESTLTRAIETNKLICDELGLNHDDNCLVKSSDLLCEGAPIEPDPPVTHWSPNPQTFFLDGSRIETAFRQFVHRADVEQTEDSVEIVVCHANVIRYFVCRALQLPPEAWLRMSLRHASITLLSIRPNGKVSLKALGDSGHLPPDKLTFE